MENSTFSTKICLKNGFRFGISKNLFQNKNQYPKDLGLKFEKTHVEIRISILEILYVCVYECMSVCMCVYVCVCVCVYVFQFSVKTRNFDFFRPNLAKNGFSVKNSKN